MSTLANAKDVLLLIARLQRSVTVTDVSVGLTLPKSSASRTLSMMAEYGFLAREPNTKAYRPGPVIMQASWQFRSSHSALALVEEGLTNLVQNSGYTGYVNVLDGSDVIVIQMRTGSRPLQVYTPPGSRVPAWASAAGRAILASMSVSARQALIPEAFSPPQGTEPGSLSELNERLTLVEKQGWSLSRGEYISGIAGISAAIFDPISSQRYGFGLAIPREQLDDPLIARWGQEICESASRIGKLIGDPYWLAFPEASFTQAG